MTETATGETTFTLAYPIVTKTRTLTEITLRRPRVGDLRAMELKGGSDTTKMLTLLTRIASLAPDEVDAIDIADLEGLAAIVAGFTEKATA
jgi:hypothetical protein